MENEGSAVVDAAPDKDSAPSGGYFADGTKRVQRNFGISENTANWLRVAAFVTRKSQSELAREAFELLQQSYPEVEADKFPAE